MIINITSNSPSRTKAICNIFSRVLKPGSVILLDGELGAGKTTFINGIAGGLGLKEDLASPSFTILNIYRLSVKSNLVHADFYRLEGLGEIINTGIEEYIYSKRDYICIEWGEKIKNHLKTGYVEVKFSYSLNDSIVDEAFKKRTILFSSGSKYWIKRLKTFKGMLVKNNILK